jgi:hypothetical protein
MPSSLDAGRRLVAMRRLLRGALTERLLYKAAALFLALVLWLVVSADQPTEEIVPVMLVVRTDSTLMLSEPAPALRARVVGPLRVVLKLYATPPRVLRSVPGEETDSIHFLLEPRDVVIPAGVNVRVSSLEPSAVSLHFTSRIGRKVPVRSRLRVTVDTTLRALGPPRLVPDSVTIFGTRERVAAVANVPTAVMDIRVRDTSSVLVTLDTTGLGVRVQPTQVRFRLRVVGDTLLPIPFLMPWNRPVGGGQ